MAGIRRSWDKNLYAAKASDRVDDSKGNSNVVIVEKREIRCLEGRDEATLNLDEKVGKVEYFHGNHGLIGWFYGGKSVILH